MPTRKPPRRRAPSPAGPARRQDGFSLVEQLIAISLLVGVLLSLLSALGSGAAGVLGGRQRTLATSLAKQAVERLQGAQYASVAMDLSSPELAADPRVTVSGSGAAAIRSFEGEPLVGGGSAPYRTTVTVAGTTYTLSTYITQVAPPDAMPHRRVTVFAEWTVPGTSTVNAQRFSSLVYPFDYASYPAANATAEVTRASASLRGTLGADTFEDVVVTLPGARSSTSSSTLRTAQGTGTSATAAVNLLSGPLVTAQCSPAGTDATHCPRQGVDRFADNDASTAAPVWLGGSPGAYAGATVATPGGATFATPSGSADAHAAVDACGGCGFGDGDAVPWSDARSEASSATSAGFTLNGPTVLAGQLWDVPSGWRATVSVDHDAAATGSAAARAELSVPAVRILTLSGAGGFDGAVKIPAFVAAADAAVGAASIAPTATAPTVAVQVWEGVAYRTINVALGTAVDETATGTVVVGADTVTLTSRVQSQPATTTATGSAPRTAAVAQLPSLLVVTVDATVTGVHSGSFTITFDYGLVTARGDWQESA